VGSTQISLEAQLKEVEQDSLICSEHVLRPVMTEQPLRGHLFDDSKIFRRCAGPDE